MSNLNANAFPIFNAEGSHSSYCEGMSKHEYAAIMIAQGLAANPHLANLHMSDLADTAISLAETILEKINK